MTLSQMNNTYLAKEIFALPQTNRSKGHMSFKKDPKKHASGSSFLNVIFV